MAPTTTPSDRLRALILGDRVVHADARRVLDAGRLGDLVEFDPTGWQPQPKVEPAMDADDGLPAQSPSWVDPLEQVAEGLSRLGVPKVLVGHCVAALPSLARAHGPADRLGSEAAVGLAEAGAVLTSGLEASRLLAARDLAVEAGEVMLAGKGLSDPGELSATARERWAASARSVAAHELVGVTGLGKGRAFELVALAMAPEALLAPVVHGLRSGVTRWQQVSAFWRQVRNLPHEAGTAVARALFGFDVDRVVVERLDALGQVSSRPWVDAPFHVALEREAKRFEELDPEGVARRRQAAHEGRDAFGIVDDDGSGQVVIGGDGASTTACTDRLHTLAKKVKAGGDERRLSQLRADIGRALLLYGTITLPDLDFEGLAAFCDDPGLLAPAGLGELTRILAGTPAYELQVIVPWDALTGRAQLPEIVNPAPTHPRPTAPGRCPFAREQGAAGPDADAEAGPDPAVDAEDVRTAPETGAGRPCAFWPAGGAPLGAEPAGAAPYPAGRPPGRGVGPGLPVGRVLARDPVFLSKTEILAIAGGPGMTFARLLIDPADGRCLERTLTTYRPDAAMRTQIVAADVTSRFPFSTALVRDGDLDHVIPYVAGGATREDDLQGLDRASHILKTRDLWQAVMSSLREVTWTSFFGRTYTTRPHDYRQYLATRQPVDPHDQGRDDGDEGEHESVGWRGLPLTAELRARYELEERQLASLLTYAALVVRQRGARLEGPEDDPDEELVSDSHRAVWIRHTREDGRKVDGPRPGTPTPEQLIQTNPEDLLAAHDWTTVPTVAEKDETDRAVRLEELEAIEHEAARARWEDRLAAATRHRRATEARVKTEAAEKARGEVKERARVQAQAARVRRTGPDTTEPREQQARKVHPDLARANQDVTRVWQDDADSPIPF